MSKPVRGNPKYDNRAEHLTSLLKIDFDQEMLNNMSLKQLEQLDKVLKNLGPMVEEYIRIRKIQAEGGKKGSEIKANMRKKSQQNPLARPYHYNRGY